jgi:hypothetical protein
MAARLRGQVRGGLRDVGLVVPANGQRLWRARQERRGRGHVGVRERPVHLLCVQAQRLARGDDLIGGRRVLADRERADDSPAQRARDEADQQQPENGRRSCRPVQSA